VVRRASPSPKKSRRASPSPKKPRRASPSPKKPRRAAPAWLIVAVWVACVAGGAALGAWLLGVVTPMDADPDQAPWLGGLVGLVAGVVAAAGIQGGMQMAGPWAIVPGLGVGVAMFGLVAAGYAHGSWLLVGLAGFIIALIGFYAAGLANGYVPPAIVTTFGSPVSAVAGIALIMVALVGGSTLLLVLGVGLVVTAATILGFRLAAARGPRRAPDGGTGR
jgi:hypothetical protein